MFLEGKVTEVAIGQIRGFVKPSAAERLAAFELFVELSVRVTTASVDDERGTLRANFDGLAAIGEITIEILRKHGCEAAKGRKDGNIALAVVALRVLNEIITPRLIAWEPKLLDHESMRQFQTPMPPPYEWERQWTDLRFAQSDLDEMRREIRAYMDTLAAIAGTPSLTDLVVPLPPSSVIPATTLDGGEPPTGEVPRRQMVRWFSPVEAFGTFWANRGKHPGSPKDRRPADDGSFVPIEVGPDDDGYAWIDYVSDLGDGFDPTMAVAFQLTRPTLTLPIDRSGDLPEPPVNYLPRGRLLVMGGDEVYPHATPEGYAKQLVLPYRMAARARTDGQTAEQMPRSDTSIVVAIPGNHDWYGGQEHFEGMFVHAQEFAGHWSAPQTERWWAVQLPHRWWLWGFDTALDNTVDDTQLEYFRQAAEQLHEGDHVIVCTPVPLWQLRQKREKEYSDLRAMLAKLIHQRGAHTPLFLSGDSHFFAHYRRVDGAADEHHITAGGGGAFMQPTHNLPEQVPYERGAPDFKLDARWPRPVESRALGTDLGNLRDPQFRWLFGIIAVMHAAFAGLVSVRYGTLQRVRLPADSPQVALRWVIVAWPGWTILALLMVAMTIGTAPNSRESLLVAGSRRYGLMHGTAQAAVFVAVAAAGRWLGPDAWWWRFVIVPVIGGIVCTILFVAAVRWINRSIKANDTLAFSSSHLTRYKHFLRMCIDPDGNLRVFAIGVDPVGKGWYEAMTTPGALVPPFDQAGAPKLHYVWGHTFSIGSKERVFELTRRLGEDHPDTLHARASYGRRLFEAGDLSDAIVELRAAFAGAEFVHGPSNPTTLGYADSLTRALLAADEIDEAITVGERALEARVERDAGADANRDRQGDEDPLVVSRETLHTGLLLVEVFVAAERYQEAVEVLEQALEALTNQEGLGADTQRAEVQYQLAQLLPKLNRYWPAFKLLEEAVDVLETSYGDGHPLVLRARVLRAEMRLSQISTPAETDADYDEKLATVHEVANSVIAELKAISNVELDGDESLPDRLRVDHDRVLAEAHRYVGDEAGMQEAGWRALARLFPLEERWARDVRLELLDLEGRRRGWAYGYGTKSDLHHRVVLDRSAAFGADSYEALWATAALHEYEALASPEAAVQETSALRTRCEALAADPANPDGHRLTALAAELTLAEARLWIELGETERGLALVGRVPDEAGWNHDLRAWLSDACFRTGDTQRALDVLGAGFDPSWPMSEPAFDWERESQLRSHVDRCVEVGTGMRSSGDPHGAVRLLEPRLSTCVEVLGGDSWTTISLRVELARSCAAAGRTSEAIEQFEVAIPGLREMLGKPDAWVTDCERQLAYCLEQVGDVPRALELHRSVARSTLAELGPDDIATVIAQRPIARLTMSTDPAAAVEQLGDIVESLARIGGPDNPESWYDRQLLTEALERAGDIDGALANEEALLRASGSMQVTSAELMSSLQTVARLSGRVGDYRRTIALCERMLADAAPGEADQLFVTRLHLAIALRDSGRPDEARSTAAAAVAAAAGSLDRGQPIRSDLEQLLAQLEDPDVEVSSH